MVLGLTGYYCSGKSSADSILCREFGFESIDVDKIGHETLAELKPELAALFGESVISENGEIDRRKLGRIVFADQSKLDMLNKLLHPVMVQKVNNIIACGKQSDYIINAALLFEMGLYRSCDKIFIIKTSLISTILRGMKRDGRTVKEIINIIKKQKLKQYVKKNFNNADIYYISNNGTVKQLRKRIERSLIETGVINVRH